MRKKMAFKYKYYILAVGLTTKQCQISGIFENAILCQTYSFSDI